MYWSAFWKYCPLTIERVSVGEDVCHILTISNGSVNFLQLYFL